MTELAASGVELRRLAGRSSTCRDLEDRWGLLTIEQDHVVRSPGPSGPGDAHATKRLHRPPGRGDFLEPAPNVEPDGPAIGRPEGPARIVGIRNRTRFTGAHGT